jgi:hypothetical protein
MKHETFCCSEKETTLTEMIETTEATEAQTPTEQTETVKKTKADFKQLFRREEKRLPIRLAGGTVITFKLPAGSHDYLYIGKKAEEFANMLFSDRVPPNFKAVRPLDYETCIQAFWLSELAETVTMKGQEVDRLTQTDWLEIGRDGLIVPYLYKHLTVAIGDGVAAKESEELDELKNDLTPTHSGETI